MNMEGLIRLPEEIIISIVASWLAVADVARLDSAVCCGAQQVLRRAFLTCLYAHAVYDTTREVNDFNSRTADWFTDWLFLRNVRVTSIYISRVFVTQQERHDAYLATCGKSITTVDIGRRNYRVPLPMPSLGQFCRNIVDIRGPHVFQLAYLTAITDTWPNIRSIEAEHWCEPCLLHLAEHCR
jgi:hypothetical protein